MAYSGRRPYSVRSADTIYDLEFTNDGRKCEADIKENGTFVNYEQAIDAKDLPAAVRNATEKSYPSSAMKEVMEETEVTGKTEKLAAFEIVLVTAGGKDLEVRVSPAGRILERSPVK